MYQNVSITSSGKLNYSKLAYRPLVLVNAILTAPFVNCFLYDTEKLLRLQEIAFILEKERELFDNFSDSLVLYSVCTKC